jgi:hypothetical protein
MKYVSCDVRSTVLIQYDVVCGVQSTLLIKYVSCDMQSTGLIQYDVAFDSTNEI